MNTEDSVLSVINKFRVEYGCDGLSDGNCGTFSLALYKILEELNLSPSIGFSYLETSPESITIKEVIANETDIHHVFVEVNGNKYDCTGKIDDVYLADFSAREYGVSEAEVGIFSKIDRADNQWNDLISLIKNDTDWKISADEFYNFYKNDRKVNESVSGFDRPTYWFYEDFGMKIGIELRGDSSDRIRISTANSAKSSRVIPWIDKVKQELMKLKYSKINVDVIFTSRKAASSEKIKKDNLVDIGYAVIEDDGRYYFLLNVEYLTGKKNLNSRIATFGLIHEWSHIWLFINETPTRTKMLKNVLNNIRRDRKLMSTGTVETYALSDDDGDELWAYMNTHYEKLNPVVKNAFWKIRADQKPSNSLVEEYPNSWNKETFESLKSFQKKLDYASQHLQKLSSGSSRTVFAIDDNKVLKLAKNKKGLAQNQSEVDRGIQDMYGDFVTKFYDFDDKNLFWVEMERAKKVSPKKFEELTGVSFEEFSDYVYYADFGKSYSLSPEQISRLENNEFVTSITSLMKDFDLNYGDIRRISSYGIVNRNGKARVVLVDTGGTKSIIRNYYQKNHRANKIL